MVASGSQISVYVNGSSSPGLSVTDGSYAAGATGVIAQDADARFDDVVARPAPGVIVYQDGSYGGLGVSVAPGEYPVIDSAGVPNDWLSSLRVPAGWRVEIYEHGAFGGASWTFTADTPLMPDASNDAASSLKVFAP